MTGTTPTLSGLSAAKSLRALAAGALCIAFGACTQSSTSSLEELVNAGNMPKSETVGSVSADPKDDLAKATTYWGKEFTKNPRDPKAALNYAKNLKAMGEKRQALAVLQQASIFHGGNRELNSEYGRLALEFDQISLAQKLLEQADDPTNPDWRVISARGTALAKQGSYRSAIPLYERALALSPEQPSVLSNLALAHAMDGHPDRAEPLLKRAARAGGGDDPRVTQNLALVLGAAGQVRRRPRRRDTSHGPRRRKRRRRVSAPRRHARPAACYDRRASSTKGRRSQPRLRASRAPLRMMHRAAGARASPPHRAGRRIVPKLARQDRRHSSPSARRMVGSVSAMVTASHRQSETTLLVCNPLIRS